MSSRESQSRNDMETESNVMIKTSYTAVGFEDEGKGHKSRNTRNIVQEAGKGKKTDLSLEPLKGSWLP